MCRKKPPFFAVVMVLSFMISTSAPAVSDGKMDFSFGRMDVLVPPKTMPSAGSIIDRPASVESEADKLIFENSHYILKLKTSPYLQLSSVYNKYTQTECLTATSRLFFIWVDGKRLEAKNFKVKDIGIEEGDNSRAAVIELGCRPQKVAGRLTITIDDSPEIRLGLSLTNKAKEKREFRTLFPYVENLQIGDNAEDNYYFFPYKGGLTNNKPYDLSSAYGAHTGSFQLMCLYNPGLGGGIYMRVNDETGRPKTFLMQKKDKDGEEEVASSKKFSGFFRELTFYERKQIYPKGKGALMGCYSYPYKVDAGAEVSLPTSVLAVHDGDFTYALKEYKKWIHTWWKHIDTPQWFKDCYYYPISHDRAGNTGWEKGFIRDNKIALSQVAQPYEHIVQISYWANHSKDDHLGDKRDYSWYSKNMGDFDYEEEWGGAEGLREEFKKTELIGPRISLYASTTYGAWKYSRVYQEHSDWAVMDKNGNESREYWWDRPSERIRMVDMCGQVDEWQDYVAQTNHRIVKDTGASAIYVDVMNQFKFCHNPKHNHPEYPGIAVEKALKKYVAAVRSADPEVVIEIEDMCNDYLMQWADGCWMKTFYWELRLYETFDLYSISFMRFCLPQVKWTDFGPKFTNGGRRAFFNGMAYNLSEVLEENDPKEPNITKQQRIDYLVAVCQLMKQNGDAFASPDCDFLVPTMKDRVYANYFPANDKKLYTLYNKNDSVVNEMVIGLERGVNFHCVELLYDEEVFFDNTAGTVSMKINPWEVVCLARLPEILQLDRDGGILDIKLSRSLSVPSLKIFVDYDDGKNQGQDVRLHNNLARIDLTQLTGKRLIIKLFEGSYLIDERIVKL